MNQNDIELLFRYHNWANARVLDQAALVPATNYTAPAPVPHGSLRGTLVHALAAEVIWRQRGLGDSPTTLLNEADLPTFAALAARWTQEAQALQQFIAGLSDADLSRTIDYRTTTGAPKSNVLWHLLAHLVNHGTQHRAEAALLLTGYGHSPGDLDLIVFLRAVP
jgi:uncharacterized damage-inducible protein DinB